MATSILATKDKTHLPGHVERREERASQAKEERNFARAVVPGGVEDFVLRPEAGEDQRHAGQRHHADGVGREGHGHELLEAAHAPDVLLLVAAVDDGAGAEEEQRLEERVREQMEHPDRHATDAQAHHHVAELRHGGVGEDALDVRLRHGDERAEDGRERAYPRDGSKRDRLGHAGLLQLHQRIHASDEEDARRHHRRRVDERADGRGAFHRVGKPDVERELAGLANRTAEEQQANRRAGRESANGRMRNHLRQRVLFEAAAPGIVEEQRAGLGVEPHDAEEEEHVADARGDEGLLGRRRRAGLVEPEADEQVAREAHQLPAHEEQQQVVRDDEAEHRGGE